MFNNLFIHVFSDIHFYMSCVNINGALSHSRLPECEFPCLPLPQPPWSYEPLLFAVVFNSQEKTSLSIIFLHYVILNYDPVMLKYSVISCNYRLNFIFNSSKRAYVIHLVFSLKFINIHIIHVSVHGIIKQLEIVSNSGKIKCKVQASGDRGVLY